MHVNLEKTIILLILDPTSLCKLPPQIPNHTPELLNVTLQLNMFQLWLLRCRCRSSGLCA